MVINLRKVPQTSSKQRYVGDDELIRANSCRIFKTVFGDWFFVQNRGVLVVYKACV